MCIVVIIVVDQRGMVAEDGRLESYVSIKRKAMPCPQQKKKRGNIIEKDLQGISEKS